MSANEQPPLILQPVVSRHLGLLVVLAHVLAALVAVLLPGAVPWWGKLALVAAVAVSAGHYWRLQVTRTHPRAVQEVRFYRVDNCLLRTPSGSRFVALDDSSFLHLWGCSLNFRDQRGSLFTLLLAADSLPQETLRRLRVRVKFDRGTAGKNKALPAQGKASNDEGL